VRRALAAAALAVLLAAPAAANSGDDAPWTVVTATTAYQAAGNVRALAERLLDDQRRNDAPAYAATRLLLLENIALLQDWALRCEDPASTTEALPTRLTAAGRKALGTRKPVDGDFSLRPGVAARAGGALDFKP
jgi:hypothetical protein